MSPSPARTANASGPAWTVAGGVASKLVSGAVVSTVNVRTSGVASVLPSSSAAATRSVYVPSASPVSRSGEVQGAGAAPLSEHVNIAPGGEDANVNSASRRDVSPSGPPVMPVSGAVVSTLKVKEAFSPTLPAASRARTVNV